MIMNIPRNQICQAFDAMMIMPEKTAHITKFLKRPSTSCVAPAYVYIEGTHGNKFLCDYHYHYEKFNGNYIDYDENGLIDKRETVLIDERERVKETFAKNVTTTETLGYKCSVLNSSNKNFKCVSDAFVKVSPTENVPGKVNFTVIVDSNNFSKDIFYCNFHFRKFYYRNYNAGIIYEDFHKIVDERSRMAQTIAEQALNIMCV